MSKHFTDKEKKQIIADYIECENYSAVARKYGCSDRTVSKIVKSDSESSEKFEDKKEQNTKDILSHMNKKKDTVCALIDMYLDALMDEERIAGAKLQQVATALAIVIDKFTENSGSSDNGAVEELIKGLKK